MIQLVLISLILISCQQNNSSLNPDFERKQKTEEELKSQYQFLNDENYWLEIREIIKKPITKKCETSDYEQRGVIRLASNKLYGELEALDTSSGIKFYAYQAGKTDIQYLEIFSSKYTNEFLQDINRKFRNKQAQVLELLRMTSSSNYNHDSSCFNRTAYAVDFNLLPGGQKISWQNTASYNFELNFEFIKLLLQDERVLKVIFNDPKILKSKEIKKIISERMEKNKAVYFIPLKGYDNQIHVELSLDSELQNVSRYSLSKIKH